jgi:RNA polymerase sigma-70 factor (ECF subfamily)
VVEDVLVTGRRSELEEIYREHGPRLWRSLLGFTGDPDVASDALAEAFAQALARGDAIRSPADWVWTTSFRIARGELQRRSVEGSAGREPHYELPEPVDHLVQVLVAVPRKQRLAVVLHDYADRPTDEVALILGVTRATVHVHLSRGRRRLRELLEERQDA